MSSQMKNRILPSRPQFVFDVLSFLSPKNSNRVYLGHRCHCLAQGFNEQTMNWECSLRRMFFHDQLKVQTPYLKPTQCFSGEKISILPYYTPSMKHFTAHILVFAGHYFLYLGYVMLDNTKEQPWPPYCVEGGLFICTWVMYPYVEPVGVSRFGAFILIRCLQDQFWKPGRLSNTLWWSLMQRAWKTWVDATTSSYINIRYTYFIYTRFDVAGKVSKTHISWPCGRHSIWRFRGNVFTRIAREPAKNWTFLLPKFWHRKIYALKKLGVQSGGFG